MDFTILIGLFPVSGQRDGLRQGCCSQCGLCMLSPAIASDRKRGASLIGAMLTVFLLACLTYHSVLNFFFTGTDTLTLVETSRVQCFGDIWRLLSEPLMAGTRFIEVAKFYRPLAALSYSFDYAVWGLNPFGFQLTNLLLNALVASLAVLVLFELSDRDVSFAWLGGVIFAIHPILVESVPATDRRQDMLAAVFLLVSLALFLKHRRAEMPKKQLILFSLVAYVCALASKEIAVILPPLVFAQVFLFSGTKGLRERFLSACTGASAYIVATVLYVGWRTHVLGGIGGYLRTEPVPYRDAVAYTLNVLYDYVTDLIYPVDLFGIQESSLADWWKWVTLALVAGYVLVCVRRCGQWNEVGDKDPRKTVVPYLLIWLALPLLLFVVTMTFSHRSMYIPAIPFSALVAYPIVRSWRPSVSRMYGQRPLLSVRSHSWVPIRTSRVMVAAIGARVLDLFIGLFTSGAKVRTVGRQCAHRVSGVDSAGFPGAWRFSKLSHRTVRPA